MNDSRLQAAVERLIFMLDRAAFKAAEQRDGESSTPTVERQDEDPHKDLFRETISDFARTMQQLMPILTRLQHTLDPLTRSAASVVKLGRGLLPANLGRSVKRVGIGWRQMQAGKLDRGAQGIFSGMRSLLGGATKQIRASAVRGGVQATQAGTSASAQAATTTVSGAAAAGGASGAAAGGGASAAVGALASNPIGWAIAGVAAVAAFTVAVAAAPSAIADFTNSVIESRRKLEHGASVEMAMVFAQKDFNKFFRDMNQGDKLAASTEWATKQQEELAKATMQLERIWAKIENYGSGILALLGKLVVDVLPWAVPIVGIAEAINTLVEQGQEGGDSAMLQEVGWAYAKDAAQRAGRDLEAERRVKEPKKTEKIDRIGEINLQNNPAVPKKMADWVRRRVNQ